jgi:hypothetical protein
MTARRRYTVMVIEDQIAPEKVVEAFTSDRASGEADEPFLELLGEVARSEDDAIEQLDAMERFPDAILVDDYLPEGGEVAGRAVEIMSWLCRRCVEQEIPLADRPRAVLWTRGDLQLAYTFCVLGGMQVRDKRHVPGDDVPLDWIWAALAGKRWQPDPFPTGLTEERFRAPLPWLEAGWPRDRLVQALRHLGVTHNTVKTTIKDIRQMPRTPKAGDSYPSNMSMAIPAAKRRPLGVVGG